MSQLRLAQPELTSSANPRIRAAAGLRDRRARERSGLTLVDGAREVERAAASGIGIEEAFVCPPLIRTPEAEAALAAVEAIGARIWTTSERAFAKVAFGDRAEGIVAVVRPPSGRLEDLALPADPLVVVLEAVEKPGNLGAVLRSADGAGADALILADPRTDPWNPNAVRASAGTVFSVPLAMGSAADVAAYLEPRAIRPLPARTDGATLHWQADLRGAVALILGSEHEGLTDAWSTPASGSIRLPMLGIADSLNVSVAAAVLLYEARRQRNESRET